MPAVQQPDLLAVARYLGHDRGHEPAARCLVLKAPLDVRRDGRQIRLVIDRLAERRQHHRRRLDRGQALALHVGDDQPGSSGHRDDIVEVAADPGRRGGRDVAHGDLELADLARHLVQEDALGHVRDRPHVDQFPLLALARGAGDHGRHRDARDRGARLDGVGRERDAADGGQQEAQDDGNAAGQHCPDRPEGDRGKRGSERQQRQEPDLGPHHQVEAGDHGHDAERDGGGQRVRADPDGHIRSAHSSLLPRRGAVATVSLHFIVPYHHLLHCCAVARYRTVRGG